jgi:signal transduction histidine kinase
MPKIRGKHLPYRVKMAFGMALTFLLFLGVTLMVSEGVYGYMKSRDRQTRMNQIQIERDALFSALQDAETGQRGYILTGKQAYLVPYNSAVERLPAIRQRLERMVADDPFQKSHLETVERLADAKQAELEASIHLRRTQGLQPAMARVQRGQGQRYMEQIRHELALMQAEHLQQQHAQSEQATKSNHYLLNILSISQILAFGLLLLLYGIIYREALQREQAERQLQEANDNLEHIVACRTEELHRSNQELEQFAFVASHDLQAPLRKIQVFTEMLRDELRKQELSRQAEDYLSRLEKSASRMQTLIVDLLAISRVNRKGAPFKKVDLNHVATEVVDELNELIQKNEGHVELGPMCEVEADPDQMRQLLVNLVSNAVKYHQDGVPPEVKITSQLKDPDVCELVVADNGIGIPPDYQEKVFEIFQRLHGAQYEGNGIGLSIVKRIVERHGGKVRVASNSGQGSQFIVQLPVHHASA